MLLFCMDDSAIVQLTSFAPSTPSSYATIKIRFELDPISQPRCMQYSGRLFGFMGGPFTSATPPSSPVYFCESCSAIAVVGLAGLPLDGSYVPWAVCALPLPCRVH